MPGLNVMSLENELKDAFSNVLPGAFEQAALSMLPTSSKDGADKAKEYGKIIDDLVSADLAKRISGAIDYYVKNIVIQGTIITVGSMVTQVAKIMPLNIANPMCGLVPNTLGLGGMYV